MTVCLSTALKRKFSFKSDVFSFGLTLWEMVARDKPWSKITNAEVVAAVLTGQRLSFPEVSLVSFGFILICSVVQSTPAFWSDLITKCWHEEPSKRPEMSQVLSA